MSTPSTPPYLPRPVRRRKKNDALVTGLVTGGLALIGTASGILISAQQERDGFLRTERLDRYSAAASATQNFLLDMDLWAAAAKSGNGEQKARADAEESYRTAVEAAWNVRLIAPAEAEEINQQISQNLNGAYDVLDDGYAENEDTRLENLGADVNRLVSDLAEHATSDIRPADVDRQLRINQTGGNGTVYTCQLDP